MDLYNSALFAIGSVSLAVAAFLSWRLGMRLLEGIDRIHILTQDLLRVLDIDKRVGSSAPNLSSPGAPEVDP